MPSDSGDDPKEAKSDSSTSKATPAEASSGTGIATQPVATAVVPIVPPTPPGQQLQVAVGMQFIQQSALSFDKLDKSVQQQVLQMVGTMDQHAFENAQENLKCRHQARLKSIEDAGSGRRQILWTVGILAALGLAAGTVITVMLINASQPQLAHTVMMSGLAVISALLGGAGLTTLFRSVSAPKDKE